MVFCIGLKKCHLWPKIIGPNGFEPKMKWAEWLIGPKNTNWLKNISSKLQSLVIVFSRKVYFKYKNELKNIVIYFRMDFSHISRIGFRIFPLF
jgi:hypothetical protein